MKTRSRKKRFNFFRIFIAIIMLIVIAFISFNVYERYSFTREKVDLTEYIGVKDDDVAIYLNDVSKSELNDENRHLAIKRYDAVYLPLSFVKEFINNRF